MQTPAEMGMPKHASFILGGAFYVALSCCILRVISVAQSTPYLDEVFHIPQAQAYCNGSFTTWDPKITTLPGTYFSAAFVLTIVGQLGWIKPACSVLSLRMFNMVVGIQIFHMIKNIMTVYMQGQNEWKITLAAINISMFPVLYFFNFLFYTDVTSTFWILAMHLKYVKGQHLWAALFGACAIFTRQTNVVWVGFHGLLMGLDSLERAVAGLQIYAPRNVRMAVNPRTRGRQQAQLHVGDEIQVFVVRVIEEIERTLPDLWGYIACVWVFIGFVFINGGIVVGDKSAHQVTLNFVQLGYFTTVYCFFCLPFFVSRLQDTLNYMMQKTRLTLLCCALFVLAVMFNTVAHPYLLADNRHYPFYFWKRAVQSNPLTRYFLIPFYVTVWAFIFHNIPATLARRKYGMSLFLCSVMQLVPTLLLEYRYYIPIYLFARMVMVNPSWKELICEFLLNIGANLLAVYIFTSYPFTWPGLEEKQRFMW